MMDAALIALAIVAALGALALWWYGRLGDALALLGGGIVALLALAISRTPRSRPPTPTPLPSREHDDLRSAGRRLDEAREVRAPTTDPDADARAAADRLNRRLRP